MYSYGSPNFYNGNYGGLSEPVAQAGLYVQPQHNLHAPSAKSRFGNQNNQNYVSSE